MRVFAGDPADPGSGAVVTLRADLDGEVLTAPFVRLIGQHGTRRIVVGAARLQASRIALVVRAA